MENFSILIPIRRKTEQVEIAIYNLREYSYNKNHEILLLGNCETPEMLQWLERRRSWLERHNVKYYHCCNLDIEEIAKLPENHMFHGRDFDGSSTATAMNKGVNLASYDWIVGISDDDLFYSKDWDLPFFSIIKEFDHMKHVFRPVHVQPIRELLGEELTLEKFWGKDWDWISAHRKSVPTVRKENDFLTEDEWNENVKLIKTDKIDFEECGQRMRMHWIPFLIHRDLIKQAKGWSEKVGIAFDLNFDDRLASLRIIKVQPGASFVLHKGIERKFLLTQKGQGFIVEV